MAERLEMFYESRDGVTQIHAVQWLPEERPPKAILQIVHGMKEHIDRYDGFARYVADRGFIVVGEDHLGHGETAEKGQDFGYFGEKDADTILVKDVHRLKKNTQAEYPGLPYYIYGFSMGSFITRKYMTMYGEGIDGVILAGTGWFTNAELNSGLLLANTVAKTKGSRHRSKLLENMVFGVFNNRISEPKTKYDWLTTDEKVIDKYMSDRRCTFSFTANGYITLFNLIKYVQEPKNAERVPENLPVLFMSGMEDPVGSYGEGVKDSAELYMVNGMKHVSIKLYDDMRHEIHNETRKHIVYLDVLEWLESLM